MNHRVTKELDDFMISGQELLCMEKALYSLLDRYKDDRINRGSKEFPQEYKKTIDGCFEKLRLHENYDRNRNFFQVSVPKLEPDPVEEILGEDSMVRQKVYALN